MIRGRFVVALAAAGVLAAGVAVNEATALTSTTALHGGDTVTVTCDGSNGLSRTTVVTGKQWLVKCGGTTPTTPPSTSAPPTSSAPVTSSAAPSTSASATPTPTATSTAPTGGYPDSTNTGVPAGTVLTPYTGSCTITAAVTIDAATFNCGLTIQAAVTITRSKVNGPIDIADGASLTISDSEVDAGAQQITALGMQNFTALRDNLHGGQNAAQCNGSNCVIADSWLHGQQLPSGANWHLDGFISNGGSDMRLTHNTIACDHAENASGGGCSADVGLFADFSVLQRITLDRNLIASEPGAAWCMYGGSDSKPYAAQTNHIVVTNNVWQTGNGGKGCGYGAVTSFTRDSDGSTPPGNVWTNNLWSDGTVLTG